MLWARPKWADSGACREPDTGQSALMLKCFALLGIAAFCLSAACVAGAQSNAPAAQSLPDAPSAQSSFSAEILNNAGGGSLRQAAFELAKPASGQKALAGIVLPEAPRTSILFRAVPEKKDSGDFFSKYLNLSNPQPKSPFRYSSSDKAMSRATDAVSRVFLLRDPGGKTHVNTQYFLRVLTSVAAENASRRYRARSGTAPLSNFGSTVGNDAGMNLLHEFAPGIRQKMAGHVPDVVSRIGQHFSHLNAR